MTISIRINGMPHEFDVDSAQQLTVLTMLTDLGMNKGRYAVEIDGNLAPKSTLSTLPLTDGMVIEVVQAVGGG